MKKIFFLVSLMYALDVSAQPVITNGNNIPLPGASFEVSATQAVISDLGSAGANQVWDFSAFTFNVYDTMEIIDAATSPFASSYPSASYATALAGTYSYITVSVGKMEALAIGITTPGTGADMTPNPRTLFPFPFSYGDSVLDTWQYVGLNVAPVTVTYDGYGTLITPTATYTNVVRIKTDYGHDTDIVYEWYRLSPLASVMTFNPYVNYLLQSRQIGTTGLLQAQKSLIAKVYPTPAKAMITVDVPDLNATPASLQISDRMGRLIREIKIESETTNINVEDLIPGVYFYKLRNEAQTVSGKIVIE